MATRLYGARTGNCRRAAIALAEAGIAYSVSQVDLRAGEHKSAAFRALNPRGLVPVMVEDGNTGPDLVLTQSNAIMFHAASRSRERLAPDQGRQSAVFLDRLFYFVTEVIAPNGSAFALAQQGDEPGARLLAGRSLDALVQAERFLTDSPYIAGDTFTLADIAAYTSVFAVTQDLDWSALPLLHAWYARIGARPGVVRGMAAF
ncbi:glutathione S-transferase family protein [Burkholderia sp. Bp9140]|uniref:glutathione S-transferase family protein n=1 Tax=Burkholderia sp. Bp9140 TaxID=2184572 RepID=UPI000F55FA1A|nr:glutathione S-transferase family protein [Burkholderia sp. Bp9140]RQR44752.1 glutathione S-transferase family protein [Burkholderia sp. Bp9140]